VYHKKLQDKTLQLSVWKVPGSNINLQTGCLDWRSTRSVPVQYLQVNAVIIPKNSKKSLSQCRFAHHFSCIKFGLLQQEAGDCLNKTFDINIASERYWCINSNVHTARFCSWLGFSLLIQKFCFSRLRGYHVNKLICVVWKSTLFCYTKDYNSKKKSSSVWYNRFWYYHQIWAIAKSWCPGPPQGLRCHCTDSLSAIHRGNGIKHISPIIQPLYSQISAPLTLLCSVSLLAFRCD
jgi:hypothetical protein